MRRDAGDMSGVVSSLCDLGGVHAADGNFEMDEEGHGDEDDDDDDRARRRTLAAAVGAGGEVSEAPPPVAQHCSSRHGESESPCRGHTVPNLKQRRNVRLLAALTGARE